MIMKTIKLGLIFVVIFSSTLFSCKTQKDCCSKHQNSQVIVIEEKHSHDWYVQEGIYNQLQKMPEKQRKDFLNQYLGPKNNCKNLDSLLNK